MTMIHGHEIDPPEELPCRECYDREHRPDINGGIAAFLMDYVGLEDDAARRVVRTLASEPWWQRMVSTIHESREDTASRHKWTTCSRCAGEARADMAEDL